MSQTDSFYKEAAALTCHDLERQKMLLPPDTIQELCTSYCRTPRRLADLFSKKVVIAGIQKAFPEIGTVCGDFKPLELAQTLERAGASALAVVTEPHFYEGAPKYLTGITHLVKTPVIRWDFVIDEYQLFQSKLWGADAVRLIVSLIDQSELALICRRAAELDLEVVAEVSNQSDIERLSEAGVIAAICVNPALDSTENLENLLAQAQKHSPALLNADHISIEKIAGLPADGVVCFQKIMLASAPEKQLQELVCLL